MSIRLSVFAIYVLTRYPREQDKPGYKPGLWACITGNLIILTIISITDVYFYFCNKKQARGELIIEPVPGTDSSVSFVSGYALESTY